jgi:hypothetical protein
LTCTCRPDTHEAAQGPEAKVGKACNDAPVLQQNPDNTPFSEPPVRGLNSAISGSTRSFTSSNFNSLLQAGAQGALNNQVSFDTVERVERITAPGAATGVGSQAMDFSVSTAAPNDAATGAAQAVFAAPMQPPAPQPVAAEEDDYDAD